MAGRRNLAFARLDEVMPDVEHLLLGHQTVGQWSLGQICNHLAVIIQGTMDGFPDQAPWLVRKTVGVLARWRVLGAGRIPEGFPIGAVYLPAPGLDALHEASTLRAALARFQSFADPCAEHPLLGPMSFVQWTRFHCLHCAHHLSFAVPLQPKQDGSAH